MVDLLVEVKSWIFQFCLHSDGRERRKNVIYEFRVVLFLASPTINLEFIMLNIYSNDDHIELMDY